MGEPLGAELDAPTSVQVDRIVALVRRELEEDLLGLALFGSAVSSGLRPSSDVDLLAVIDRPTTDDAKRRLIDDLLPISGSGAARGPARSIEMTIVVRSAVQPWRYPPLVDFQYGDWLRPEFERGVLRPWHVPNPDLAIMLTSALQASRSLHGPPIAGLLDPVPPGDLVRAMLDELPGLLVDLEDDARNVLLTLARIWTTLATGEIRSKDAAADWVLEQLPAEHRMVLEVARAEYRGDAHGGWDHMLPAARACAEWMGRAVETMAP
jgi:predicted nucleotidyltransferase